MVVLSGRGLLGPGHSIRHDRPAGHRPRRRGSLQCLQAASLIALIGNLIVAAVVLARSGALVVTYFEVTRFRRERLARLTHQKDGPWLVASGPFGPTRLSRIGAPWRMHIPLRRY